MTLWSVLRNTSQLSVPLLLLAVLLPSISFAQSALTYQGRIIRPDGRPLDAANVNITVQVKSPGSESCVLFQETHIVDMRDSAGIFTLNIGTGVRASSSVDGGFPLSKVFSNTSTDLTPLPNCAFGHTYRPNMADVRKLIISFNDGSGVQTLAAQNINFVPFAIEASQLTGFSAENLLRAPNTDVPELTAADMNKLLDLIAGTSPVGGDITGNPTSTTVTALQGHPISSATPSSSQVLKWNGTAWAPAADSFTGTFSGDIGGTINTTIVNAIQGHAVSSNAPLMNYVLKWNGTAWTPSPDTYDGDLAGDITGPLTTTVVSSLRGRPLSATAPNNNEILKWNGAAWVPAADGFSGTFSGDISGGVSSTVVSSIRGNPVASATPGSGDVLKWNGTQWSPAPDNNAGGTLTSVGITMPSFFTVTGSPATGSSGTFGVTLNSQSASNVLIAPTSGGVPTFRGLAEADIPTLTTAGKVSGNAITSGTIGGSTSISTTGSISTSNNIITSGRFVAGAASETTAKVEVDGQVLSKVHNNGSSTAINWNNGNVQYTSANCGAMTFSNMFEGGAYTLIVTGTAAATCGFTQSSPDSLAAGAFKFVPALGPTVAGKTTVFTMLRAGNIVYVSWIAGY